MSALAALLPPIPFTASHALHKNNSDHSSARYQRHFDCILYSAHFFVPLPEPPAGLEEPWTLISPRALSENWTRPSGYAWNEVTRFFPFILLLPITPDACSGSLPVGCGFPLQKKVRNSCYGRWWGEANSLDDTTIHFSGESWRLINSFV